MDCLRQRISHKLLAVSYTHLELHDTNIAQRVEVIVEHFRTTVMQELGGQAKAMVITASRQSAVKYRQAFEDYIAKRCV